MEPIQYRDFISHKLAFQDVQGVDPALVDCRMLFDHQTALTRWACRKGRAAIFADTGLGKTRIQLAWADAVCRATEGNVIILAPLAVGEQTVAEGVKIGVKVTHARSQNELSTGISITNYERLHLFEDATLAGVVLDESSIIKHHDSKTLARLLSRFRDVHYRLCATATPAPNDWAELGTHAEFLGVCSRAEMLAEFFIHDAAKTQDWRLKGHAQQAFWQWVSHWGALLKTPSDLGFDDGPYKLPPMHVHQIQVSSDQDTHVDDLFHREAQTLSDRRQARRDSLHFRIAAAAEQINASAEPWIIWCELNAEGEALHRAIPDATEIRGADTIEHKERSLQGFSQGRIRVLITKPKIAGYGLNWQHCANVTFIGVTDSWESYYQAVRRCWRFGQKREVNVYIFASLSEGAIKRNLEKKEKDAEAMSEALRDATSAAVFREVMGKHRMTNEYNPQIVAYKPRFLRT